MIDKKNLRYNYDLIRIVHKDTIHLTWLDIGALDSFIFFRISLKKLQKTFILEFHTNGNVLVGLCLFMHSLSFYILLNLIKCYEKS